ncbi:MAG: ribonuclease III [Chloroflexi bacterium]|nr:ribonuclease III [Chloroflexota bacterium]
MPHPLEQRLGVTFCDKSLLTLALTHSSRLNESIDATSDCNERLEFLGDAVLGAAIAQELYARHPEQQEGVLTSMRSSIVRGETLADVARRLELGRHLLMGAGEVSTGGCERASNLAAAFEAIVGAVFLDQGYESARLFCLDKLGSHIASLNATPNPQHPKSALQELVQGKRLPAPKYRIIDTEGQPHAPTFTAEVVVDGAVLGTGTGRSKSLAEQEAAREALAALPD